ncbi:MAG: SpoIIE family protein phosphatase, partial [Bacteroidota bacterium]
AGHLVNSMVQVEERIYCATEDGVSVFNKDGDHKARYSTSDSLSSDVCNDIVSDWRGNIWVATDLGLSRITGFEDAVITKFGKEEGLTSNVVYFLEFSDSTLLWLGTEKGLYRYNVVTGATKYYGVEDGFYPLETFRGAVTRGSGKDLWMGTVSGLVHYMPDYDIKNPIPPDIILFSPDVDSVKHRVGAEGTERIPVFPYNRNSLVFSFTGIHTTIPAQNSFSYYLEGYDEEWSLPGNDRKVSYTNLANGDYLFRVKAYNLDGVASEEASFAFTIKLPFWKTVWFIIFELLAGLSLIYGIIKYRERQLVREKRILETKVKVRTREIEEQKEEIETQRDEITVKNREITDSIHYAKHIQNAVLPGKLSLEKALPEHFILFKPRDIVSGDFYWVEEKSDRIIVCAADCTGHGVPGAFMSMLGLTFLNEIVNKDEILKAGEILDRLRIYIINALSHRDIQARDGMDLSLIVIDKKLGIMDFSGAYNPLLLVRDGELIEYKGDKMPIGKHEGEELPYTSHKIELRPDDMIYLFSDGFPDQFGGPKGGKYKARPFKKLLLEISKDTMDKQETRLEIELKSWMGGIEQIDDILVMGIRYNHKD